VQVAAILVLGRFLYRVNKDLVRMDKEIFSKLKPLVSNSHQWDHFSNYLDVLMAQQHKILEQSENMINVHKAQGAIEILRKIRRLREDVTKAEG
jgi:hypothetical protein